MPLIGRAILRRLALRVGLAATRLLEPGGTSGSDPSVRWLFLSTLALAVLLLLPGLFTVVMVAGLIAAVGS